MYIIGQSCAVVNRRRSAARTFTTHRRSTRAEVAWPNSVIDEKDERAIARCRAFVRANDWYLTRSMFSLTALRHGRISERLGAIPYQRTPANIIDHEDYMRDARGRATAIVSHPYAHIERPDYIAEADRWAADHELVLHRCADPHASWYCPLTRLVVLTRRDVEVVWPDGTIAA